MSREETPLGLKTSRDDKEDLEYVKLMVECMFEEVCQDGVDVEKVEEYLAKEGRRRAREKR